MPGIPGLYMIPLLDRLSSQAFQPYSKSSRGYVLMPSDEVSDLLLGHNPDPLSNRLTTATKIAWLAVDYSVIQTILGNINNR
jgi:hypothetical protein